MTTSVPVPSLAGYETLYALASAGTNTSARPRKVEPPPQLPSQPNLSRQFGDDPPPEDYVVYLPSRDEKADAGPIYSKLNPAKARKTS
jgi:hypothetical protein